MFTINDKVSIKGQDQIHFICEVVGELIYLASDELTNVPFTADQLELVNSSELIFDKLSDQQLTALCDVWDVGVQGVEGRGDPLYDFSVHAVEVDQLLIEECKRRGWYAKP